MKQTIDLMKPRYRVIADWPSLDEIVIGDIIEGEIFESESLFNTPMHDFPHLFKKLEWWEERKPEDMPGYVKVNSEKTSLFKDSVLKVKLWGKRVSEELYCLIDEDRTKTFADLYKYSPEHFLPATKEEFDNYLKSKS